MIENINLKSDYFARNIFIFWCFKYFLWICYHAAAIDADSLMMTELPVA